MKRLLLISALPGSLLILSACATVTVKPIKVEPIHVVVDVNVTVRVDHQLDQFFAFEESPKPATQPATPLTKPSASSPTGADGVTL